MLSNYMKLYLILIGLVLWNGCIPSGENNEQSRESLPEKLVLRTDFRQIIDSTFLNGSILIYDPQTSTYYSNDFERCKRGFLPASTFKIPNSLIALEMGIISSDTTLIKWDGKKRRLPVWEKDMTFRDAFHLSCVPCYQEIARKIGVQQMNVFLHKFQYGNMIVDSTSIDNFWLDGESTISQFGQIKFLSDYYFWKLPINMRTFSIMKRMMIIDKNDQYTFSGKTGWAIRNENNYGWFVGFLEKGKNVYFIATHIEPKESFNMDLFPKIRSEISMQAFRNLGVIGK